MAAADAPRTAQHTAMGPGIFHVVEAVLLSLPPSLSLSLSLSLSRSLSLSLFLSLTVCVCRYGTTHPEYFALNPNGKRGPLSASKPDRVKMCVSNPELWQAVAAGGTNHNPFGLSAAEDDSNWGFCQCDKCKAWDAGLSLSLPLRLCVCLSVSLSLSVSLHASNSFARQQLHRQILRSLRAVLVEHLEAAGESKPR